MDLTPQIRELIWRERGDTSRSGASRQCPWGSAAAREGNQGQKLSVRRHQHPPRQLCCSPWVNLELARQHHGQGPSPPSSCPTSRPGLFWQAPGSAAAPSAKFWPLSPSTLPFPPLPNHSWPCLCHFSLSCMEPGLDTWILGGGEG